MAPPERPTFHPWIARVYDLLNVPVDQILLPDHREALATDLDGRVLELGVGTGAMLPYYGDDVDLYGVEPDPNMRRRLRGKIEAGDGEMALTGGRAERLPFPDDAFDAVVASLVFCSVPAVDAALTEITRVLAPGGEFRFLDHVRSDGLVGRFQDRLTPTWRRFGGGCHLNRTVGDSIRSHDAFAAATVEYYTLGYFPIRVFVRGTATPADG